MEQQEDITGRELSLEEEQEEDMRRPLEVQTQGKRQHSSSEHRTPDKRHHSSSEDQTPDKRQRSSPEQEEGINDQPTTSESERLLEAAKEELRDEIHLLELARLCRICWNAKANIFFFDCGHVVTCGHCCFISHCPACEAEVIWRKKIHFS